MRWDGSVRSLSWACEEGTTAGLGKLRKEAGSTRTSAQSAEERGAGDEHGRGRRSGELSDER